MSTPEKPNVAHDFDLDQVRTARLKPASERSFRLNGKTFVHRVAVPPEDVAEFRAFEAVDGDNKLAEVLDLTMSRCLEPSSAADWVIARAQRSENPITLYDMLDVVVWVVGQVGSRPTVPSEESSTSSTQSGAESTAPSGSAPAGESWD